MRNGASLRGRVYMLLSSYEKFWTDTAENASSPSGWRSTRAFRVADSVFSHTGGNAKGMERYQSSELEPVNQGFVPIEIGDREVSGGRIRFAYLDAGRTSARTDFSTEGY